MRGRSLRVALALLAALPIGAAPAQDSGYPDRLVTIVAPSAPGGLYSLFGRILGARLEQRRGSRRLHADDRERRHDGGQRHAAPEAAL
jgi:tripartite-type tricarboxylate transporter receptor subunit TctC